LPEIRWLSNALSNLAPPVCPTRYHTTFLAFPQNG
jgi:hypothetical protein